MPGAVGWGSYFPVSCISNKNPQNSREVSRLIVRRGKLLEVHIEMICAAYTSPG
jgi:hypothetical protein